MGTIDFSTFKFRVMLTRKAGLAYNFKASVDNCVDLNALGARATTKKFSLTKQYIELAVLNTTAFKLNVGINQDKSCS